LCVSFEFFDHGSRRGNTAQALNQLQHPVASSEALDVLHWVMPHASYGHILMAIEIASNLPTFFVVVYRSGGAHQKVPLKVVFLT
jgi:hypothetical protein